MDHKLYGNTCEQCEYMREIGQMQRGDKLQLSVSCEKKGVTYVRMADCNGFLLQGCGPDYVERYHPEFEKQPDMLAWVRG